ncbi:PHB depolymerase family esterase [Kitasatospora sp. A2-31]|uniref:extracellular catalytic domain type 1 short-chain-length polyhydroxyalkanoate depolymerase n=1 Tax=Kitasatospora sp. A2-31 TaxID=2916414 RepID=UPI001EEF6D03|nr:PHB depolymerase family esterase [Kitasatospora sp. A2-31]MCG6499485.1 PHB depolymerase family esterase [Kitasatospora sp. A2-31]MCG6500093.1 PHB depolymerase family esterase [Kitasatospora sp. A2-31]
MFRFRSFTSRLPGLLAAVGLAVGLSLQAAPQAAAASLTQITNFGTNPTGLLMHLYVPNNVRPDPPILLALHGCQGTGPYMYSSTDFGSLADRYGFLVIYPSTNPGGSCWDVSSDQALTRNGGSDPVGLMSMITYTEQHYGGNANAVYVTGESSGGMMTNVMLADYPDVFKAGAAFMGVPYHCFHTGTVRGWNGPCAQGQVSMTPQQWGDLARGADRGYTGPRPRVQLWHGTADTVLSHNNLGEEIKEWTDVLGVSRTPSATDTPAANWNRTRYDNSAGVTQVEAYSIVGAGHQLPVQGTAMAATAVHFMGLDGGTSGGGTAGALKAVAAGKCLTDANGTALGTQQRIYACNGGANQAWTRTASKQLTVTVGGSTLCLDAEAHGTSPGTKAIVWSCNGQANQQWQLNPNGTVTGVQSGLCLDVAGLATGDGTPVQLWTCSGGSNQQWKLG